MTGTLQLAAGSLISPSLIFTGSLTSGLSANSNNLSFTTSSSERLKISSAGVVTINNLSTAGVVHNDVLGNLTSSLIVDADISSSANILDTKLNTISTSGKVSNSATTATNVNTPNTIVLRDTNGNFSAGTITAALIGNASTATTSTNFAGSLNGDVTGTQGATVVASVGGQSSSNIATSVSATTNATNLNTFNTIVKRDGSGNFSAGTINANLNGNASTSTLSVTSTNFSGSLSGDVTGTQSSTVVSTVGGLSASTVANGVTLANNSTNLNTASTIVRRDGVGNFSAGTITATLNGNALTANTSTNFSGSLSGDVTGTQSSTVVSSVGGLSSSTVASGVTLANNSTNLNSPSTIVRRDASGNFNAGTITATLIGNVTGSASLNVLKSGDTMSGSLTLPTGLVSSPSLLFSGSTNTGLSASSNILSISTNGSQRFSVNATGVVTINAFSTTGVVHNNASGNLTSSLIVDGDIDPAAGIVDTKLATISTSGKVSNSATTATTLNNINTIVLRDGSGNFSAGTITATLIGNASTATFATTTGSTTNFSGSLSGDVTGTQSSTVVSLVGGVTAANVAAGATLANDATSANTASAIVRRDVSGNIAVNSISIATSLIIPDGSSALPSLNFASSTTTGLSAGVANTLSVSANAVQVMTMTSTDVTTLVRQVNTSVTANQGQLVITVTTNNQTNVALATTSMMILILNPLQNRTGHIMRFPPNPINGQLFSIVWTATANTLTFTNSAGTGGASIVNGITTLSGTITEARYVYYSVTNAWYCTK
jgi:hypothetical protein